MLRLDSPVERSMVPLPSAANVFTTQLEGKPFTSTGGPKKQFGSNAQPPGVPAHSTSLVHSTLGSLAQCLVAFGPREQSAGPVPKLAVRLTPSVVLRIDVALSGTWDARSPELPPPM